MESRFESKIGMINAPAESIFKFFSNFNNFEGIIPKDKIQNWQAGEDWCRFQVEPVGQLGLKIVEKEPNKLIKISAMEGDSYQFLFWIQLKEIAIGDTRIKLTIQIDMNPMMKMMVSKQIQSFLDKMIDQLSNAPLYQFSNN